MSVAHVFNGFKPLTLLYDGKPFHFPYNDVTKIADQRFTAPDERSRNHESAPNAGALLEQKVEAIPFVTNLLNRHYLGLVAEGVVWVGEGMPTDKQKAAAIEKGRIKKMKLVEQALADRRTAMVKGGQPELDTEIVEWMESYGIFDPLYNKAPEGGFTDEQLKQIGAITGAVIAGLQKPQQPELSKK